MIITNSLGSNYTAGDRLLALKLLFQPWRWNDGPETELLKDAIRKTCGDGRIASFQKGRQAITEALQILKIGSGDEVIIQAFTCIAVVQPILDLGATPVYVDVDSKNLNPSFRQIKNTVTPRTKAIILQHTLGFINRENDQIAGWCRSRKIFVIQDLAHAFGSSELKRSNPASAGLDLNVLSFSQDKVIDGVSGGGLVASGNLPFSSSRLNDLNHLTLMEIGRSLIYPVCAWLIRSTYQIGIGRFGIGKGIHWLTKFIGLMNSPVDTSAKPTALPNALAAIALNQLNRLEQIIDHRRRISLIYDRIIDKKFKLITSVDIKNGSCLRYPIWVEDRDQLENQLTKYDFYLMDHWYDAPVSPNWVDNSEVKYRSGSCPNAENLSKHIFNLPTHINISEEKAEELAKYVNAFIS